jgi:hypothetical protein
VTARRPQCCECDWWERSDVSCHGYARCLRRVSANKKRKWLKVFRNARDKACGWFRADKGRVR